MKLFIQILLCLFFIPSISAARSTSLNPIAEVIKLRGEVTQLSPGAKIARKVEIGDKFTEDTSIVTSAKSFVKIKFIDSSEVNLGPESKIVITEMKKESVGIISLLKGKIRTEVQKDAKDPESNKFYVKTRTAAMGVRGTEFQTIYNPDNKITSLLTYKGEVAMAKIDEATHVVLEEAAAKSVVRDEVTKEPEIIEIPAKKLDQVEELNKLLEQKTTVLVPPGQNSFSSDALKKASLPVKISPIQLEALYKNEEFKEKAVENFNLKTASDEKFKPSLKVAEQVAPLEGLYNAKTGDFAPKSGGFIDVDTALYVSPGDDSAKIGNIDGDTGEYVAPKGLVLDANKGFILADDSGKSEKAPELLALKEDMNKNIAKDFVVGAAPEEVLVAFNINEKFIRDRIVFSLWGFEQRLEANKDSMSAPYLEITSKDAVRFGFTWQMATNNRFSPMVGIDYSVVNFKNKQTNISQESEKLMGLSFGLQYALNQYLNLYSTFGLHQDHYLDQTASGAPNTYNLKRIVLTRLSLGGNFEFWRRAKYSLDANAGGFVTFRKRINNLIINEGAGINIEVMPKYALSERKWLGLGLKVENHFNKISGSSGVLNRVEHNSSGFELKYISEF